MGRGRGCRASRSAASRPCAREAHVYGMRAHDISQGGVKVEFDRDLEVGSGVVVTLPEDSRPSRASCAGGTAALLRDHVQPNCLRFRSSSSGFTNSASCFARRAESTRGVDRRRAPLPAVDQSALLGGHVGVRKPGRVPKLHLGPRRRGRGAAPAPARACPRTQFRQASLDPDHPATDHELHSAEEHF